MPNYAIVENGLVTNTVAAEPDYAAQQGWVQFDGEVGIGWGYANGQFVDTRVIPPPVDAPPTPTKEELMAELAALTAKIQALE
jgi:hypothetical protein